MTEETELITKMTKETEIKSRNGGFMGVVSIILGAGGVFLSYLFIFLHLDNIVSAETAAASWETTTSCTVLNAEQSILTPRRKDAEKKQVAKRLLEEHPGGHPAGTAGALGAKRGECYSQMGRVVEVKGA